MVVVWARARGERRSSTRDAIMDDELFLGKSQGDLMISSMVSEELNWLAILKIVYDGGDPRISGE
jgi:hypothetical protein